MFDSVLIANRGEIAARIIRTLRRLGIKSIAVYSDADRDARHVALADAAFRIGPSPAAESYLRSDAILEAAARAGADALHPGYGFLAENASFARATAAAGCVFIGPPPEAIELMGAKDRAKATMAEAGVPLVPGYHDARQDDDFLLEMAADLGFPVLLKAVSGGGGKGMRVVETAAEFSEALAGARREAEAAFGDPRMLLERYLRRPRHVEVQVFGDQQGRIVHLFERDCSLQRRHQKVIEEAPAPGLSAEQRSAVGRAAVRAASAIGYVNAGTVEFLMDTDGSFFFMEMNTRLQVEHPVTEMVTGQDLVEWQLRVAAGEPLPLAQEAIELGGHAIEARLYAEDPARGFLPSTGRLVHLRWPEPTAEIRIETGVVANDVVTPFYDPMIAKIVAWGVDRAAALERLRAALDATEIVGPATNLDFLAELIRRPEVAAGGIDTGFIERVPPQPPAAIRDDGPLIIASLWLLLTRREQAKEAAAASAEPDSPWHRTDAWRINDVGYQTLWLGYGDQVTSVLARVVGEGYQITIEDREFAARAQLGEDGRLAAEFDGRIWRARIVAQGPQLHLFTSDGRCRLEVIDPLALAEAVEETSGALIAPMPGKITRQFAAEGDCVARGTPLLVLEAMKMEHTIAAPGDGRIQALHVAEGDQVEEGLVLLDFESAAD